MHDDVVEASRNDVIKLSPFADASNQGGTGNKGLTDQKDRRFNISDLANVHLGNPQQSQRIGNILTSVIDRTTSNKATGITPKSRAIEVNLIEGPGKQLSMFPASPNANSKLGKQLVAAETILQSPAHGTTTIRESGHDQSQMSVGPSSAIGPASMKDVSVQEMASLQNEGNNKDSGHSIIADLKGLDPYLEYFNEQYFAQHQALLGRQYQAQAPPAKAQFWSVGASKKIVGANLQPFPAQKVHKQDRQRANKFAPSPQQSPRGATAAWNQPKSNEKATGIEIPSAEELNQRRVSGLTQNLNVKQLSFMQNSTAMKAVHKAMIPGQTVQSSAGTRRTNHMFKTRRNTTLQPLSIDFKNLENPDWNTTKRSAQQHLDRQLQQHQQKMKRQQRIRQRTGGGTINQEKKTINLQVNVVQDNNHVDGELTEQRSNFDIATPLERFSVPTSAAQRDQPPTGLGQYDAASPDSRNRHHLATQETIKADCDDTASGQPQNPLASQIMAKVAGVHQSSGGVSQRFDRPIPKLHLKAISAERKRSKKDRQVFDELILKLSKLESSPPNQSDRQVPNEYAEPIEEPPSERQKTINIQTSAGAPGGQKESQSNCSIRENEWHQLQANGLSSSLAPADNGEVHAKLDTMYSARRNKLTNSAYQPSPSEGPVSTTSRPDDKNAKTKKDEIVPELEDYKSLVNYQVMPPQMFERADSRASPNRQSNRQVIGQYHIRNGFMTMQKAVELNIKDIDNTKAVRNVSRQTSPQSQQAQQWNQNNAFLKDKKLDEKASGEYGDAKPPMAPGTYMALQQFVLTPGLPMFNTAEQSVPTGQSSKINVAAPSNAFNAAESKDSVNRLRSPRQVAVQSGTIKVNTIRIQNFQNQMNQIFDDSSSHRDYNAERRSQTVARRHQNQNKSATPLSRNSQKSIIKMPKVQFELASRMNETGINSETPSPSVSPISPRTQIGPKLGAEKALILKVRNMETTCTIRAANTKGKMSPRQQFGAIKPQAFPIDPEYKKIGKPEGSDDGKDQQRWSERPTLKKFAKSSKVAHIPQNKLMPTQLRIQKLQKEAKCVGTSTLDSSPSIAAENIDFLKLQEELQTSMNRALNGQDPTTQGHSGSVDIQKSAKLWHDHIVNRCFPLGPLAQRASSQLKVKHYNLPLGQLPQDQQYIDALVKLSKNIYNDQELYAPDTARSNQKDNIEDEARQLSDLFERHPRLKNQQMESLRTDYETVANMDIKDLGFQLIPEQDSHLASTRGALSPVNRSPVSRFSHPDTPDSGFRGWGASKQHKSSRMQDQQMPRSRQEAEVDYTFNTHSKRQSNKVSDSNLVFQSSKLVHGASDSDQLLRGALQRDQENGNTHQLPNDMKTVIITEHEFEDQAPIGANLNNSITERMMGEVRHFYETLPTLAKPRSINQPQIAELVQKLVTGERMSARQQYRQRQTVAGTTNAARRLLLQQGVRPLDQSPLPSKKQTTGSLGPLRLNNNGHDKTAQRGGSFQPAPRFGTSLGSNKVSRIANVSQLAAQMGMNVDAFQPFLTEPEYRQQYNLFTNEAIKIMNGQEKDVKQKHDQVIGGVSFSLNRNRARGMTPAPQILPQHQYALDALNVRQAPLIDRVGLSQTPNIGTSRTRRGQQISTSRSNNKRGTPNSNLMPETCSVKIQDRIQPQHTYTIKGQKEILQFCQQAQDLNLAGRHNGVVGKYDQLSNSQESITQKFLREAQSLMNQSEVPYTLQSRLLLANNGQAREQYFERIEQEYAEKEANAIVNQLNLLSVPKSENDSSKASPGAGSKSSVSKRNSNNKILQQQIYDGLKIHSPDLRINQQILHKNAPPGANAAESQVKGYLNDKQFKFNELRGNLSNESFAQTQKLAESPDKAPRGESILNTISSRSICEPRIQDKSPQQSPGIRDKCGQNRQSLNPKLLNYVVQGVSTGVVETDFDDLQTYPNEAAAAEQTDESALKKSTTGEVLKPKLPENRTDEQVKRQAVKGNTNAVQQCFSTQAQGRASPPIPQGLISQTSVSGTTVINHPNEEQQEPQRGIVHKVAEQKGPKQKAQVTVNKITPELVEMRSNYRTTKAPKVPMRKDAPKIDTSLEEIHEASEPRKSPNTKWPSSRASKSPNTPVNERPRVKVPPLELSAIQNVPMERNEQVRTSIKLQTERDRSNTPVQKTIQKISCQVRHDSQGSKNWQSDREGFDNHDMIHYASIPAHYSIYEFDRQIQATIQDNGGQKESKMRKHLGFWQQIQVSSKHVCNQDSQPSLVQQSPRISIDFKARKGTPTLLGGGTIDGTTHHFLPQNMKILSNPEQILKTKSLIDKIQRPTIKVINKEIFQNSIMKTKMKIHQTQSPFQKKLMENSLIKVEGIRMKQNDRCVSPLYMPDNKKSPNATVNSIIVLDHDFHKEMHDRSLSPMTNKNRIELQDASDFPEKPLIEKIRPVIKRSSPRQSQPIIESKQKSQINDDLKQVNSQGYLAQCASGQTFEHPQSSQKQKPKDKVQLYQKLIDNPISLDLKSMESRLSGNPTRQSRSPAPRKRQTVHPSGKANEDIAVVQISVGGIRASSPLFV